MAPGVRACADQLASVIEHDLRIDWRSGRAPGRFRGNRLRISGCDPIDAFRPEERPTLTALARAGLQHVSVSVQNHLADFNARASSASEGPSPLSETRPDLISFVSISC
jgi:hypothetical protein